MINIEFKNLIIHLFKKTRIEDKTNCWIWQGGLANGYGQIQIANKKLLIHRLSAYIYLNYDLNDKINQINHKLICPSRNCWNPNHLYIGTQSENIFDTIIKGRHTQKRIIYQKGLHEMIKENIFIDSHGNRNCRICRKETKERYRMKLAG